MSAASDPKNRVIDQQRDGVNHAGDGCAPTALDVGGGAGDGPGRGYSAEQRGDHVGHALGHQLHVRPMASADHPVRNDRRQQRLDRPERRDCQRRAHQLPSFCQRHGGNREVRKAGLDLAETGCRSSPPEVQEVRQRGRRRSARRTARVPCDSPWARPPGSAGCRADRATAYQFTVRMLAAYTTSRSMNSGERWLSCKPSRSRSC